jgi:putative inorganic carbon (HCO3(-)) transporter
MPRTVSAARTLAEAVVRTELLWLALLSPLFLFPNLSRPLALLALLALPALWVARRAARGRLLPSTPLDWPICLLLVMVLVSIFATFDLTLSFGKIMGLIFGVACYYALVDWASTSHRLMRLAQGYILAGAGLSTLALLGTDWSNTHWFGKLCGLGQFTQQFPQLMRGLPGAEGGFNPNEVGGSLLWVLPVSLGFTVFAWTERRGAALVPFAGRCLLVAATLLTFATLALTQSRGAILGALVAVLLIAWLYAPRARRLVVAGVAGGALAVVLLGGPNQVAGSVQCVSDFGSAADPLNLGVRSEAWSLALQDIGKAPLTGIGMNTFRALVPALPGLPANYDIGHAHNQFLQAALDLGLPGMLAYVAIWLVAAALVLTLWRRVVGRAVETTGDGSGPNAQDITLTLIAQRWLVVAIACALLASFIFNTTDAITLGAKPGVFFWVLLALLVALWRQTAKTLSNSFIPGRAYK